MDDPGLVRGAEGAAQLLHDGRDQRGSELARAVDELLERLALGPFEGEVVEPIRLPVVVGADDVGVGDPGAVFGLAQEPLDRDRILRQSRAQQLDRGRSLVGVLGSIDGGGPALADVLREVVPGDRATYHVVGAH